MLHLYNPLFIFLSAAIFPVDRVYSCITPQTGFIPHPREDGFIPHPPHPHLIPPRLVQAMSATGLPKQQNMHFSQGFREFQILQPFYPSLCISIFLWTDHSLNWKVTLNSRLDFSTFELLFPLPSTFLKSSLQLPAGVYYKEPSHAKSQF